MSPIILDVGSKKLLTLSLTTRQRQTLVTNLPVGAPPGVIPKPLLGVPDLIPGPLSPFAGLAAGHDDTITIAGDGGGSVLTRKHGA